MTLNISSTSRSGVIRTYEQKCLRKNLQSGGIQTHYTTIRKSFRLHQYNLQTNITSVTVEMRPVHVTAIISVNNRRLHPRLCSYTVGLTIHFCRPNVRAHTAPC